MPIYEYRCEACNEVHEALQKASDAPLTECPACGEPRLRKLIGRVAVMFKGSGFHVNDYSRSGGPKSEPAKSETSKSEKSDKSETSKPEPAKSEKSAPKPSESSGGSSDPKVA